MRRPNIAILGATGVVGREITKIVDEFKEDTLDIILNDPDRLTCIPHLPKARIEKIHKVLDCYNKRLPLDVD